jgi:hypothetical protein
MSYINVALNGLVRMNVNENTKTTIITKTTTSKKKQK